MNVTIRLFASLRQFGPDEQVSAFPEGTTIDDVIHSLSVPGTIRILRIVNGEHRPADHVLKDGDELALFPPSPEDSAIYLMRINRKQNMEPQRR